MPRFLDPDVMEAARQHALAAYPNESCGAVTAAGYVPLRNTHPDPRNHFECSAELEPLQMSGALLALVHSHPAPDNAMAPSAHDIAQQVAFGIPWGIVFCDHEAALPPYYWGDQLEPPPLEGRDFRYGPSGTDGKGDCAALVRDWYRLKRGVTLPEYVRERNCWKRGEDLYRANLRHAGFRTVVPSPAHRGDVAGEEGDVLLLQIMAKEPNHSAVWLGHGLLLHHFENRLSLVEPWHRWKPFITDWLRYDR